MPEKREKRKNNRLNGNPARIGCKRDRPWIRAGIRSSENPPLRGVFTVANWDAEFKYFQNFWRLASSRQFGRGFRGAFRTLFGRWREIFTFASKFWKFWSLGARKFISRHEAKAFRAISLHFGRGGEEFCGKLWEITLNSTPKRSEIKQRHANSVKVQKCTNCQY